MPLNSKSPAIAASICVLAACSGVVSAQPQQGPPQAGPQFPQSQGEARPPAMRDFQEMIESQRSQARGRIAEAVGRIEAACSDELEKFCSTVTPGEGRRFLCMQAHEDKLSTQCELALFDASRNVQQMVQRLGRIAQACWTDIQMQCGGEASVAQCIRDKRALMSPRCQTAAAELRPPAQQEPQRNPSLAGMPIYSADGVQVGEVTAVKNGLDGKPQMLQAELGRRLGLGTIPVLITPDEFEMRADALQLRMRAEQIEAVLQEQIGGARQ
jgi:hypothetical protein